MGVKIGGLYTKSPFYELAFNEPCLICNVNAAVAALSALICRQLLNQFCGHRRLVLALACVPIELQFTFSDSNARVVGANGAFMPRCCPLAFRNTFDDVIWCGWLGVTVDAICHAGNLSNP